MIVKKMKKRMMIMMIVSIFMNHMTTPWRVMKISIPKKCSSLIITIIPNGHNCRLKSNLIKQVMNYHSLFIWTRCIKLHLKTCKLWEYISKWNTLIKSYPKLIHNMLNSFHLRMIGMAYKQKLCLITIQLFHNKEIM